MLAHFFNFTLYHARSMVGTRNMNENGMTLCSFYEIMESRNHVLSGGTQRRDIPRHQSEGMKIFNILFP